MFTGMIREPQLDDLQSVADILDLYWTDKEFKEKLNRRLREHIETSPESTKQEFKWFIAEENGEVVGVAAMRKAPEHMRQYAVTGNPAEFYINAAKYKGRGIGTVLRMKRIEEARRHGYTEVLFFSPESHNDSWKFHDNSQFQRVGPATAPDEEPGFIWRMIL